MCCDSAVTSRPLAQLLHPVGGLEEFWHGFVEARDDLVDGLLPRLLGVLVHTDCLEELSQRRLESNKNMIITKARL